MTSEIDPMDGCSLPPEEALALLKRGLKSDAELYPDYQKILPAATGSEITVVGE